MAALLDVFRPGGRLDRPLLILFLLIFGILLTNAILHDPTTGYDARDHQQYVQVLADHWRLPTKTETGQYYSPPLPYLLPAVLTALHFGLWKALKAAQFFNALLGGGLLLYLLRICSLVAPRNRRLRLLSLGLLGMLPVFYRSFALIRGEPYLAFLAVFIAYESLSIFLKQQYTPAHVMALGLALGLAVLARQWGFFLFPPVIALAAWAAARRAGPRAWRAALSALLLAAFAGGWFYLLVLRQYGTLTAFDRPPQPVTAASASAIFGLDASTARLFTDPFRPSLSGRVAPIFYADTWGDYWGYFLVYARDLNTGDFIDGKFIQKFTDPGLVPPSVATNRFTMPRYLGVLNALALLPSALLLCGFIYGCIQFARSLLRREADDLGVAVAFLTVTAGATLLGFLWFIGRYQSAPQAGDLVKTTYVLQAFPALAFTAAAFVDRAWDRHPAAWRLVAMLLGCVFVAALPAFVTHYVHLSTTQGLLWLGISTVLLLGGLGLTYWIHTRYMLEVVVKPVAAPDSAPLISVCIPARNEERNIRRSVEAVLAQTYPSLEVIVVDDRSTDATPLILKQLSADARLHVLRGSELPDGWAGKPHALAQASAAARGEWLCFVDADTFLVPEALASCYQAALATRADLFTMLTHQIMGSFWERVVMPLVMTGLSVGFPPRQVNDPASPRAVANGQFLLIKRGVYDAIGGHERIKDEIVDDKAMAELVKYSGRRLVLADGQHLGQTRMYTSLPEMWEGWTKNIFLGLRNQPNLVFWGAFGSLLLLLAALFMPVWPLLGLWWYLHGGGWLALGVVGQALLMWAALLYARAAVDHGMGISRWYALTLPLGAAVFAAMMLSSAWKVSSGRGVTWRGRRYDPRRPQPR